MLIKQNRKEIATCEREIRMEVGERSLMFVFLYLAPGFYIAHHSTTSPTDERNK